MSRETISITAQGYHFCFDCMCYDTYSGFAHSVELTASAMSFDVPFCDYRTTARASYLNRTWEEWKFQSVCRAALGRLADELEAERLDAWKCRHDYKRMTAARREEYELDRPGLMGHLDKALDVCMWWVNEGRGLAFKAWAVCLGYRELEILSGADAVELEHASTDHMVYRIYNVEGRSFCWDSIGRVVVG